MAPACSRFAVLGSQFADREKSKEEGTLSPREQRSRDDKKYGAENWWLEFRILDFGSSIFVVHPSRILDHRDTKNTGDSGSRFAVLGSQFGLEAVPGGVRRVSVLFARALLPWAGLTHRQECLFHGPPQGARSTASSLQVPGPAEPMARTRKAYSTPGVRSVTRILVEVLVFTACHGGLPSCWRHSHFKP